jgi:hypothetical protein
LLQVLSVRQVYQGDLLGLLYTSLQKQSQTNYIVREIYRRGLPTQNILREIYRRGLPTQNRYISEGPIKNLIHYLP